MEFNFYLSQLFKSDEDGICLINGGNVLKSINSQLTIVLDAIGTASAKAQGLKATITTGLKFIGTDQRIYMKVEGKKCIGFLKMGVKKLFIRDELGNIKEISPLCVLDFYVHESQQRSGHGKALFTKMLDYECVEPRKLAYDRPSDKLLSFLEKHYNLTQYVPQNNNFVVYNEYFEVRSKFGNNKSNYSKISQNSINTLTNTKIINSNKKFDQQNEEKEDSDNSYNYFGSQNGIYTKKKVDNINNKFSQQSKEISKSANKPAKKDFYYEENESNLIDHFSKININSDMSIQDSSKKKNNKQTENKYSYDFNQSNNFPNPNKVNKNPPWAVNGATSNFIPTSSSYGAYFALNK